MEEKQQNSRASPLKRRIQRELLVFLLSLLAAVATVSYSMIVEHRIPPELCWYLPCSLRPEWGCGVCDPLALPAPDPYAGRPGGWDE